MKLESYTVSFYLILLPILVVLSQLPQISTIINWPSFILSHIWYKSQRKSISTIPNLHHHLPFWFLWQENQWKEGRKERTKKEAFFKNPIPLYLDSDRYSVSNQQKYHIFKNEISNFIIHIEWEAISVIDDKKIEIAILGLLFLSNSG